MEEWKPVRNYEGKYMVSNTGEVKSLNYRRTGKERILRGVDYVQYYKDSTGISVNTKFKE